MPTKAELQQQLDMAATVRVGHMAAADDASVRLQQMQTEIDALLADQSYTDERGRGHLARMIGHLGDIRRALYEPNAPASDPDDTDKP